MFLQTRTDAQSLARIDKIVSLLENVTGARDFESLPGWAQERIDDMMGGRCSAKRIAEAVVREADELELVA